MTLLDGDFGEKKVWQIVGEPEADAKKLYDFDHLHAGPRAHWQAQGCQAQVATPFGIKVYRIEKVEWR